MADTQNLRNLADETADRAAAAAPGSHEALPQAERTYVLDTSVLLSDPGALFRFAEHAVVLPVVVITELEKKRHDPEIGYFARRALRLLDGLREQHLRLDFPVPVGEQGGTLRVELNHSDFDILPSGMRLGDNDTRILAVAQNLANEGLEVTVVSKDLPMRVKASALGLGAEEYRAELASDDSYSGVAEIDLDEEAMAALWDEERLDDVAAVADLPLGTGLILNSPRGHALGRVDRGDGGTAGLRLVRGDREVFGVHGRSAEQRLAT